MTQILEVKLELSHKVLASWHNSQNLLGKQGLSGKHFARLSTHLGSIVECRHPQVANNHRTKPLRVLDAPAWPNGRYLTGTSLGYGKLKEISVLPVCWEIERNLHPTWLLDNAWEIERNLCPTWLFGLFVVGLFVVFSCLNLHLGCLVFVHVLLSLQPWIKETATLWVTGSMHQGQENETQN